MSSHNSPFKEWAPIVFGSLLAAAVVGYFALAAVQQWRSLGYVPARVLTLEVRVDPLYRGRQAALRANYEYEAAGQRLSGRRIAHGGGLLLFPTAELCRNESRRILASRQVFVDPSDPTEAVLHRGPHPSLWTWSFFPLAFVLGSVGAWLELLGMADRRPFIANWFSSATYLAVGAFLGALAWTALTHEWVPIPLAASGWGAVPALAVLLALWRTRG